MHSMRNTSCNQSKVVPKLEIKAPKDKKWQGKEVDTQVVVSMLINPLQPNNKI